MKKINFKKFGILLAMMLVAGAALVGPVSAGTTVSSDNGLFYVNADGTLYSSNNADFSGYSDKISYPPAGRSTVTIALYNQGGYYMEGKTVTGTTDKVTASDNYNNAMSLVSPYAQTDFSSQNPVDEKYQVRYWL